MSCLSLKAKAFDPFLKYPEVDHEESCDCAYFQHDSSSIWYCKGPGVPSHSKISFQEYRVNPRHSFMCQVGGK